MIPADKLVVIRQALVTAMGHAVAGSDVKLIEVLADVLGYCKAHYRGGATVPGLHVNTRQGFLIIGGGNPTLDTSGIRIRERTGVRAVPMLATTETAGGPAEAKAENGPPPTIRTRTRHVTRTPATGGGRCAETRASDGKACGGMLMMVGDVAVCQLCGAEATPPEPIGETRPAEAEPYSEPFQVMYGTEAEGVRVPIRKSAPAAEKIRGDATAEAIAVRPGGVQPHAYLPDYQAMGDCSECGHVAESPLHIPPARVAMAEGEAAGIAAARTCTCGTVTGIHSFACPKSPGFSEAFRVDGTTAQTAAEFEDIAAREDFAGEDDPFAPQ